MIRVGQALMIPNKEHSLSQAEISRERDSAIKGEIDSGKVTHTIAAGDTLWQLAKRYKVKTSEIEYWNQLSKNKPLKLGQKLVIWKSGHTITIAPELTAPTPIKTSSVIVNYKVKAGDSIDTIARHFHTTPTLIESINRLKSNSIRIGKLLKIPSAAPIHLASNSKHYTIKAGDTLNLIAERHHVKTKDLKAWNHIADAGKVRIGQVLEIR